MSPPATSLRLTGWMSASNVLRRWAVFNAVGALGVLIQLAVLGALAHGVKVHYLVATVVAVEAAILHNFVWHQHWTWKDRAVGGRHRWFMRLLSFNLLNGGISLAGNAAVMALLSGAAGVEPVAANGVAILLCSAANFVASETLVFRSGRIGRPPVRIA